MIVLNYVEYDSKALTKSTKTAFIISSFLPVQSQLPKDSNGFGSHVFYCNEILSFISYYHYWKIFPIIYLLFFLKMISTKYSRILTRQLLIQNQKWVSLLHRHKFRQLLKRKILNLSFFLKWLIFRYSGSPGSFSSVPSPEPLHSRHASEFTFLLLRLLPKNYCST